MGQHNVWGTHWTYILKAVPTSLKCLAIQLSILLPLYGDQLLSASVKQGSEWVRRNAFHRDYISVDRKRAIAAKIWISTLIVPTRTPFSVDTHTHTHTRMFVCVSPWWGCYHRTLKPNMKVHGDWHGMSIITRPKHSQDGVHSCWLVLSWVYMCEQQLTARCTCVGRFVGFHVHYLTDVIPYRCM